MKKGIHPEYVETTIKCACGFTYKTYSTRKDMKVDICSQCHPLYTGKTKILDSAGRVERYRRRFGETKGTKIVTAKEKTQIETDKKVARKTVKKVKTSKK